MQPDVEQPNQQQQQTEQPVIPSQPMEEMSPGQQSAVMQSDGLETNIAQPPQTPPSSGRKRILIFLIITAVLVLVVIAAFVYLQPKLIPAKSFSYNGLEIGMNKSQAMKKLGKLNQIQSEYGTVLADKPEGQLANKAVVLDKNQKVKAVSIFVGDDEVLNNYDYYTKKYGKPEGEYYYSLARGIKVYVFPQKGFSLMVEQETSKVDYVFYFSPMPLDEYLFIYGQSLEKENPLLYK